MNSTSSLTELGTIISGISTEDLLQVSASSISSISITAFTYMPATTVNALTSTQLAGLSLNQIVALQKSPYYSYFSDAIISAIQKTIFNSLVSDASSNKNLNIYNLLVLLLIYFRVQTLL